MGCVGTYDACDVACNTGFLCYTDYHAVVVVFYINNNMGDGLFRAILVSMSMD